MSGIGVLEGSVKDINVSPGPRSITRLRVVELKDFEISIVISTSIVGSLHASTLFKAAFNVADQVSVAVVKGTKVVDSREDMSNSSLMSSSSTVNLTVKVSNLSSGVSKVVVGSSKVVVSSSKVVVSSIKLMVEGVNLDSVVVMGLSKL